MDDATSHLDSWVRFLNSQDASHVASFLHSEIVILAFQEGPDGPCTRHEGLDAVVNWVQFPPKGRFIFRVLGLETRQLPSSHPSEEECITVAYQVDHADSDWSTSGQWTFSRDEGLIRTIQHVPNALDES